MSNLPIPAPELLFVADAARFLERPGALIRAADFLGKPIELGLKILPERTRQLVTGATHSALSGALSTALTTLPQDTPPERCFRDQDAAGTLQRSAHVLATLGTGSLGGFFGWPGLLAELPVTTALMLRSVAATARDFGEDPSDPAVRVECLTVFAHGGRTRRDDEMDSSYLALRAALSDSVRRASVWIAKHGALGVQEAVAKGSAPALVRLVTAVASRFDVVVTEKLLAESVPVLGALGGGAINAAFTDWFNTVARYHFGLRSLERRHGVAPVRIAYRRAAGLPVPTPVEHVVLESRPVP